MSIEKKSLISTLRTTRKANVAKEDFTGASTTSVKSPSRLTGVKGASNKALARLTGVKGASGKTLARLPGRK